MPANLANLANFAFNRFRFFIDFHWLRRSETA